MKEKKNDDKEIPIRCRCGSEPVWTKAKPGYFYACPECLIRGGWRRTLDEATKSWNAEVRQTTYINRDI